MFLPSSTLGQSEPKAQYRQVSKAGPGAGMTITLLTDSDWNSNITLVGVLGQRGRLAQENLQREEKEDKQVSREQATGTKTRVVNDIDVEGTRYARSQNWKSRTDDRCE